MTSIFYTLLARSHGSVMIQDEHAYSGTRASPKLIELPAELLQGIANLLPLSSAASLTFCSRYTYWALGTQYWRSLRPKDQSEDRKSFLELLSRDLTAWILSRMRKVSPVDTNRRTEDIMALQVRIFMCGVLW